MVEYCESLFFDAWESGRCKFERRDWGEVINGGSGGWFGFAGDDTGAEELAGDEVADMTSAIAPDTFAHGDLLLPIGKIEVSVDPVQTDRYLAAQPLGILIFAYPISNNGSRRSEGVPAKESTSIEYMVSESRPSEALREFVVRW